MNFKGVDTAVIYLGGICNFDCKYCDRDYVNNVIGAQGIVNSDYSELVTFFKLLSEKESDLSAIGFHGGEPFLFVKRMDAILDLIAPMFNDEIIFHITTNGSKIPENEWFFKKWNSRLRITLSYDFQYQEINRTAVPIEKIGKILKENKTSLAFQYVFPIDGKSLDQNAVANVISTMKKADAGTLNIIPLRHLRGATKFDVLIDDININSFAVDLMRFLQTMYINGVNIKLDGNDSGINKNYLDDHSKLILGPDGYIYPEFDYLEYKLTDFRTGKWKNGIELYRQRNEDDQLLNVCTECPSRDLCGLKYLYKIFDEHPKGNCAQFYRIINAMVKHLYKLKTKQSLLNWVGYHGD